MKLKTKLSVSLTLQEAQKLLTKFVEKKLNKKVVSVDDGAVDGGYVFHLLEEEADLSESVKQAETVKSEAV